MAPRESLEAERRRMERPHENAAKHLNAVIDDYLEHREEYLWTQPAHPDPEPQRRTAA